MVFFDGRLRCWDAHKNGPIHSTAGVASHLERLAVYMKLTIQAENETALRRNLVPPGGRIFHLGRLDLHLRVCTFGDHDSVRKSFERGQIQADWQHSRSSIDAGNEPTRARPARKNGGSSGFAHKTARFIPARRRVSKYLERFRRQGLEKFRLVSIVNDSAGEDDGRGQLMRSRRSPGVFLGRT